MNEQPTKRIHPDIEIGTIVKFRMFDRTFTGTVTDIRPALFLYGYQITDEYFGVQWDPPDAPITGWIKYDEIMKG